MKKYRKQKVATRRRSPADVPLTRKTRYIIIKKKFVSSGDPQMPAHTAKRRMVLTHRRSNTLSSPPPTTVSCRPVRRTSFIGEVSFDRHIRNPHVTDVQQALIGICCFI